MYEIKCCICGKETTVINSRYRTCSKLCSKVLKKQEMKRWYFENKAYRQKHLERVKKRYRKNRKDYFCIVCGSVLPHGNQKFCLNCLLKDYKYGNRTLAYNRLTCRGYDKEMIDFEVKERNI